MEPRGTGKTSTARILAKALNGPGGPRVDFDPDDPLWQEIAEGNSLDVLEIDVITHFRHLLVTQIDPNADSVEIPAELKEILDSQNALISTGRLLHLIDLFAETDARMKWAPNKKPHLELGYYQGFAFSNPTLLHHPSSQVGGVQ